LTDFHRGFVQVHGAPRQPEYLSWPEAEHEGRKKQSLVIRTLYCGVELLCLFDGK
jgi:hypothetical protein